MMRQPGLEFSCLLAAQSFVVAQQSYIIASHAADNVLALVK